MPYHSAYQLPFDALDIVVVDDSQPMRQILHSVLIAFGVRRLRLYPCGEVALEEMVVDPPNMLITDWHMKPMDGYELLRLIRKSKMMPLSLLPVIMVTGFASRQFVQKCFDVGVQQFLVKPVSPNAIHERIKWTLSDSRPLICRNGTYNLQQHVSKANQLPEAAIEMLEPAPASPFAEPEPDEPIIVNDSWQI